MRNTEYSNLYEYMKDFPFNTSFYAKDLDYRGNEIIEYSPDLTIDKIEKILKDPERSISDFFVSIPDFFMNGDYCNGTLQHANRNELIKEFISLVDQDLIIFKHLDFSTKDLIFNLTIEDQDLMEILSSLMDYPVMNDEEISRIESDLEYEYMITLIEDLERNIEQKINNNNFFQLIQFNKTYNLNQYINFQMDCLNLYIIFETGENAYLPNQEKFMENNNNMNLVELFQREVIEINPDIIPSQFRSILNFILKP